MKKFLIVCVALVSALSARSQTQFGVKAGMNLSSFRGGVAINDITYKVGFNAGLICNIPLFSGFQLQPEIMYSGEGYKWDINQSTSTGVINTNNINIPVLFKYQHPSGLLVETGPQIGFMLSATANNSGQYTKITSYPPTNFSWVFGLGYRLPESNLGFDVRYNLGFTNLVGDNYIYQKAQVFQIGLFYLFNND